MTRTRVSPQVSTPGTSQSTYRHNNEFQFLEITTLPAELHPAAELKQGGCEPEAEQVALIKYQAILQDARARIGAAAAAAAGRA